MKRILLIFLILIGLITFTGCIVITAPDCCQPPITIKCNVIVISTSKDVYGEIIANNEGTGQYFLPNQSYQSIIISLPCNEVAIIFIRDGCGYVSDKKSVYPVPGEDNYVIFYDWGPYGVKNGVKGKDNCQNCHHM